MAPEHTTSATRSNPATQEPQALSGKGSLGTPRQRSQGVKTFTLQITGPTPCKQRPQGPFLAYLRGPTQKQTTTTNNHQPPLQLRNLHRLWTPYLDGNSSCALLTGPLWSPWPMTSTSLMTSSCSMWPSNPDHYVMEEANHHQADWPHRARAPSSLGRLGKQIMSLVLPLIPQTIWSAQCGEKQHPFPEELLKHHPHHPGLTTKRPTTTRPTTLP